MIGIVGIDPSLTATGLVAFTEHPKGIVLCYNKTVRSNSALPIWKRLRGLSDEVGKALALAVQSLVERDHLAFVVIEDPTDFYSYPRQRRRLPQAIGLLGMGAGAAMTVAGKAIQGNPKQVVGVKTYGSKVWYPKSRSGNIEHPMKKEQTLKYLRSAYIDGLDEHQTMAVGIGMFHVKHLRWKAQLDKATGAANNVS